MEDPQTWNLLTSSLAVSELASFEDTWSFLVLQGLVRTDESARKVLERSIGEVLEEGEITGPSMALRVAGKLQAAGVTTDLATQPDPWAKTAKARRAIIQDWTG